MHNVKEIKTERAYGFGITEINRAGAALIHVAHDNGAIHNIMLPLVKYAPSLGTDVFILSVRRLLASGYAIDLDAAEELGITVCGTSPPPGGTAELTWGLILALARQIPENVAAVRAGGWQVGLGIGLRGHTLGLLGLGTIGTRVGRVGQAFGMEVVAWSPNLDATRAAVAGAKLVSKDDLFRLSDVLTLHIVLSERTRHIVGARELALMKKSALFVNTSRGPLVEEAALVDALTRRAIAGAAVDAFAVEPLPRDHPLRQLPNALLTPHIGYVTEPGYRSFYGDTVENVLAFLDGRPIRVMNPEAGQNAAIPAFL